MAKIVYYLGNESGYSDMLRSYLKNEDIDMSFCGDPQSLPKKGDGSPLGPDLVIIRQESPDPEWINLLKMLRPATHAAILVCPIEDDPTIRIKALSLGADACIAKDINPMELVAFIKAVLRRDDHIKKGAMPEILSYGDIQISEREHTVMIEGSGINLTPTEFSFLAYMIKTGRAVSKDELLRAVWHAEEAHPDLSVTGDLVKRLRKKLKKAKSKVSINSVWGFGYRLSLSDQP